MSRNVLIVIAAVVLILGLLLYRSFLFTVSERELAVLVQFGNPVKSITQPGLYFKLPVMQEVRRLPKTQQLWRSSASETLVDLPTEDGKKIEVSAWAIWRINDPEKFVRVLRTVDNGENAIKLRVRSVIRDVIGSYKLSEVVRSTNRELTYSFRLDSPSTPMAGDPTVVGAAQPGEIQTISIGRQKLMDLIKADIRKRLQGTDPAEGATGGSVDRGIELVDVGISHIGFVPLVREAAFDRLKAFMESIAAGYYNAGVQRKQEILNQTQAEVEKILGEGAAQSSMVRGKIDAEAIEKFAVVITETGDFYNFTKTLELYEQALGGNTRLILTTDSELFRLMKSSAATPPQDLK
ncbi:protease modulator HflC [Planctomicrobium piriforme]|uniref:Protein HflC n=1 Tax=Planctomicrobium piriforme TaxID=1576369 RepID=A0A1I3K0E3_9PLAN|nr:protease modulator HflC [Planctomicrobium piriforme]SFI65798.1 membrane protease subunit HflC [Planctomicrobium piriforme]